MEGHSPSRRRRKSRLRARWRTIRSRRATLCRRRPPRNIPSPWFPRPIAAKVMMARTSPAASLRLLIVASSTSPSTFATPWKASLLRCSTGITLIPDGGAFASGPEPIGPGLGGAASGSRRLNLPLVSTTGSFSEARGVVVTRGWAIRRVREPGRAERSARAERARQGGHQRHVAWARSAHSCG